MIALVLAVLSLFGGFSAEQSASYALGPAPQVSVGVADGSIDVVTGGDAVEVIATRRAPTQAALAGLKVVAQQNGGALVLRAVYPPKCATCSVALALRVPAGTRLDLQTTNGRITARGLSGDARITSSNGTLAASYAGLSGVRSIEMSSEIGRVTLALPAGARLGRVTLHTLVGRINSDWPLSTLQNSLVVGASAGQTIEAGGVELTLSTLTGSLNLLKLR